LEHGEDDVEAALIQERIERVADVHVVVKAELVDDDGGIRECHKTSKGERVEVQEESVEIQTRRGVLRCHVAEINVAESGLVDAMQLAVDVLEIGSSDAMWSQGFLGVTRRRGG
jgi:hypothetical protein